MEHYYICELCEQGEVCRLEKGTTAIDFNVPTICPFYKNWETNWREVSKEEFCRRSHE